MSSKPAGYNNIAFKVRVYDALYEKIVLEAGQLHLTVGEYARRVLEDRHHFAPLPPAAKPVAVHAAPRTLRCNFISSPDPNLCMRCGRARQVH